MTDYDQKYPESEEEWLEYDPPQKPARYYRPARHILPADWTYEKWKESLKNH